MIIMDVVVNQMIHDLGTPSSEVGYKAGQIEGYFSLAEFLTSKDKQYNKIKFLLNLIKYA